MLNLIFCYAKYHIYHGKQNDSYNICFFQFLPKLRHVLEKEKLKALQNPKATDELPNIENILANI